MKIDEQWECRTLCANKNEGTYRGGGGHLRPRLVQTIAEVKPPTRSELGWNVKAMI